MNSYSGRCKEPLEAEITINYSRPRFAESVMHALVPDNRMKTGEMRITATVHGRTLKITIKGCRRIETLQATIQDIFRCVRAAESSIEKIKC